MKSQNLENHVQDKLQMSEWKETELGIISNVQTGPFGSQLKNEQYVTGGTPVVTVEHIKDFRIIDQLPKCYP